MMAVEMCSRCDRFVDLDWHVEDIIYVNDIAVCTNCCTEEEQEDYDG